MKYCKYEKHKSHTHIYTLSGKNFNIFAMLWYSRHTEQEHNCCCPVAQSCLILQPQGLQHARLPCPPPTPRARPNSCLSSWLCHPVILSSFILFFFCLQSFPASGSFPTSQFFTSGGQSIGVSASTSVLPMNIQDWFPLGWTGLISLQSKGLSRVFSSTTVQKHQFFGAQLLYSPTLTSIHDYWKNLVIF